MDIVSRLKIFLENKRISNSVFADKCKIARPTLSQLLTGRNKKVSDEVVAKIHNAYPKLSIMWLLFGEGEMEAENLVGGTIQDTASENLNISSSENKFTPSISKVINFDENSEVSQDISEELNSTQLPEAMQMLISKANQKSKDVPVSTEMSIASKEKRIVSIMVFYSDNSFDTFVPSQK